MADFTLTPTGAANPYAPANVIIPVSTLQSDATTPASFRASTAGVYAVFAHNATYGSTIVASATMQATLHDSDDLLLGAVVRSGANAGCLIGVFFANTGGTPACAVLTVAANGTRTAVSTNAGFPTPPAANDVYEVTVSISAGTATITATQNGSAITFSANTTTTYAGEASLAAGGSFDPQFNNTTRVSSFSGTGVASTGGVLRRGMSGGFHNLGGGMSG